MNAERLLEIYEQISEAPDAIARLRRFVLDLAVRGKLVEQDAGDESASHLLEKIKRRKAAILEETGMRKPRKVADMNPAEIWADLPANWAWTQISDLGFISPRNEADDDAEASFVPMPMIFAEYGVANEHEVRPWGEIKKGYTHFAEGDVGLAKITPCFENGKSTVFRNLIGGFGSGTTELHVLRPVLVDPDYVVLFLKSPQFIETGIPKMTGTAGQKRVSSEYFTSSPFPLPPLPEQRRIVAKVDELMALCDRLEEARKTREEVRDKLTAASLARLTAPDTTAEDFPTHAAFALEALPTLTTRPHQIKNLRQTILNLAVRGKLVEQDPADEPAHETLKRLLKARQELEEQGRILKIKKIPALNEPVFEAPHGWEWCPLVTICDVVDPNPSHRMPRYVSSGGQPFISSQNFVDNDGVDYSIGKRVDMKTVEEQISRFSILEGAFGFSRIGTIGKTRPLARERSYGISHAVCVVNPVSVEDLSMRFLRLAMSAEIILEHAHHGTRSVGVPDLGMGVIRSMSIPLPPVAEQHRIVARVDALMALCDQLEAALTTADTTRTRLLEALLHEALEPATEVLEAAE